MALFRLDFIDYSTEIDAPVEEVFTFFKDVEKWPTWTTAIKEASDKFAHLGKAYELTDTMKDMLANGKTYY